MAGNLKVSIDDIDETIRYLKQAFPQKPYQPKDSHSDIMYREGSLAVIRYLEHTKEKIVEDAYSSTKLKE